MISHSRSILSAPVLGLLMVLGSAPATLNAQSCELGITCYDCKPECYYSHGFTGFFCSGSGGACKDCSGGFGCHQDLQCGDINIHAGCGTAFLPNKMNPDSMSDAAYVRLAVER